MISRPHFASANAPDEKPTMSSLPAFDHYPFAIELLPEGTGELREQIAARGLTA
jgi:hypothetical protein